jgi:hypothetical protein
VTQVSSTPQNLIVAAGSCLLFEFNTCWGFFCSLCDQLATSTSFIASELGQVDDLCVEPGSQVGTIVGTTDPQYQVGFVYEGGTLPNYNDFC